MDSPQIVMHPLSFTALCPNRAAYSDAELVSVCRRQCLSLPQPIAQGRAAAAAQCPLPLQEPLELAAMSSAVVTDWPCHGGLRSSDRSEELGHPTAESLCHNFVGNCLVLGVFGDVEQGQRHTQWSLSGPGSTLTSWISSSPVQLLPDECCQSLHSPLSSSSDFLCPNLKLSVSPL